MTATEQAPPEPPVGLDTLAAWRRRRQAAEEHAPPSSPDLTVSSQFSATADTPGPGLLDMSGRAFAEAQQTGLAAMFSIAKTGTPPRPLPWIESPTPLPGPVTFSPAPASGPASSSLESVITVPTPATERHSVSIPPVALSSGRAATRRAQANWRRSAVWKSQRLARIRALPLTAILTVQAILSLRLMWSNTAFPDEALYLWSGRLEWAHWLHGTSIPNFPTYFSGAPVVYPPLGAMASAIGGLIGARILSLAFMLSATALLHGVTRRLFNRRAANFAAALFVGLAASQFLGAFATYDAMALMLLALATWLSVRAAACTFAWRICLLLAAAGALALADAAKYAATLFDIIVIVIAGLAAWRMAGRKNGIVAVLTVSWVLFLLLFAGIRLGGHTYWRGINYTTLTRAHGTSSAAGIITDSFGWAAVIIILAAIGSAVAVAKQAQLATRVCACVMGGAIILAPANQARIHVFTSLFKHVGFGAWFAAAVAGYALASFPAAVPAVKRRGALIAGTSVAIAGLLAGASLAQTHFVSWPNTAKFISQLRPLLPAHKGRVLAADNGNVIEYYLPDELNGMIFSGPWFLRYQDPNTGKYLASRRAYSDAVKHRYFSVIALSFGDSRAIDEVISKDIRTYGGYQLVATLPYRTAGLSSAFRIWVREDSG
jgi:hypothetical protein